LVEGSRSMPNRIPTGSRLPQPTTGALSVVLTVVLAALVAAAGVASAAPGRQQEWSASVDGRPPGEPIMAIVSLQRQQITIYDAKGWILRAPVSSGQKGHETPAGIFAVLEKEAEHYSNLYDDASMPHMQRLTWSGIALHGGVLPGHPASHGCIRLPYGFADRLFDLTKVGMRVIVAPGDAAPVTIAQPSLFPPAVGANAEADARAAAVEADEAAAKVDEARRAVAIATREAARATVTARVSENQKRTAEQKLAAAERAVAGAASDEAREAAKDDQTKAAAALADAEARFAAAKEEAQAKLDAVVPTRQAVIAAATDARTAAEKAHNLAHGREPVSILISRKTQHLYVRQSFEEVLDLPITIRDPERPIGTHIFTAMDRAGDNGRIEWTVVSLQPGHAEHAVADHGSPAGSPGNQGVQLASTEQNGPEAALERIVIPPESVERIASMLSPRSSVIISDEGLSSETGRHTDFVVLLSGEPQGGIANRRRGSGGNRYHERSWGSPFRSQFYSTW
jgi:L,D-transpeptidase catalytic domain